MSSARRVLLVFNPAAGAGRVSAVAAELSRALAQRGFAVTESPTCDPGAHARAGDAVRLGLASQNIADLRAFDAMLVLGGDGTMHDAIHALPELAIPVGFVGVGSVNVLSRELALPRPDADRDWLARTLALVEARETLAVPVALARAGASSRRFLLFAEAGLLGAVVVNVNRWRCLHKTHGRGEFARHGAAALLRVGRPILARCRLGSGEVREIRCSNLLATRVRRYAGTMRMPGTTTLADRAFDVIAWRSRWLPTHATLLGAAMLGLMPRCANTPLVQCLRADAVEIEDPSATSSHADAEDLGGARIELSFDAKELRLLVPPARAT